MVSIGGLDRTIIVWNVQEKHKNKNKLQNSEEDDGLDEIDDDIDLPNKAITRKLKQ